MNRLAETTSPYLRQHADNPVDWYAWGPEAFARARAEDRPVLLSVGYAACHWCHVMAHESFEDPETAALMNARFINIKVDREERPDIDAIYQKVVQLMGQGGGWPLTVFLTPDQRPFFGGTYFPPLPNYGRPSFRQVLLALSDLWQQRRGELDQQVENFSEGMADLARLADEDSRQVSVQHSLADANALDEAARHLLLKVDGEWGGFGRQPKFPNPTALELLLQASRSPAIDVAEPAATAVLHTLTKMHRGGIYDHLRGGFARYSVDRVWLVPHFEKMLYDNAQLLGLYAEASRVWPDQGFLRDVVVETVAYLVDDMRDASGGFHAATDADSEGVEGKFFCWTPAQLCGVLGDSQAAELFAEIHGVTAAGNFEHGLSILHLPRSLAEQAATRELSEPALRARLTPLRERLLAHRYTRVPPLRDDKLLTAWNALAVSGLLRAVEAAESWDRPELAREWLALAEAATTYLVEHHITADGRVLRAAFAGHTHTRGYAEDLGALARACLDLHEHTLVPRWLQCARDLAHHALTHHASSSAGFYMTADDGEVLIERSECEHDSALPSGLGLLVEVLLRLDLSDAGPPGARATAEAVMHRYRGAVAQPFAYASLLTASRHATHAAVHVKLLAASPAAAADLARQARAERAGLAAPLSLHYVHAEGLPAAIVCRGQTCSLPLHDPAALASALH
ncbi:MAG: thioredoxin domain-containing protein [Nannocystis sp.]|uniref:thioredoxin domain-containing protein n=1 Tax=Nannocystis sp. TaxID=1962667 RepID=UPI002423B8E4|nr:thioredoxin domain-containing protein [Nannocystis sp.]MBK9753028.1 thioredoxin domain-containing protein [Nannocystis sp.]